MGMERCKADPWKARLPIPHTMATLKRLRNDPGFNKIQIFTYPISVPYSIIEMSMRVHTKKVCCLKKVLQDAQICAKGITK